MAKKRAHRGTGSIHSHKTGKWAGVIGCGYDEKGYVRRYVYGKTREEVQEKLTALRSELRKAKDENRPAQRPDRETVEGFLTGWLRDVVARDARPSTLACYEIMVRKHIASRVGRIRLDQFYPDDVRRLQTGLRESGAGPRVQRLAHAVLHSALQYAVTTKKISRNPSSRDCGVKPPRYAPREMRPLTLEQAQALLEAARGDRLEALYTVALTTGMRFGELLGLRWDDVNLKEKLVSVRRSLQVVGKRIDENAQTKTEAGRRRIDLTSVAVKALLRHKEQMLKDGLWRKEALVPAANGRPLDRHNVTRRSFQPLLKRAGLPRIRFHDLRHTFATTMLTKNIHPKIVQQMLGHANITVTLNTYSHVLPSMQKEAVGHLEAMYASN